MKQVILNALEDCSHGQINLESKAAREVIANLIMVGIESNGWYLNLGEKELNSAELDTAGYHVKKIDENTQVDHQDSDWYEWVCDICGKNTYNVEWDYIGTNTNHLSCELKSK